VSQVSEHQPPFLGDLCHNTKTSRKGNKWRLQNSLSEAWWM